MDGSQHRRGEKRDKGEKSKMKNDFTGLMEEHIRENYEFEGKTIGEDVTLRQIVDACLKASLTVSRKSKTFKKAKDKFT